MEVIQGPFCTWFAQEVIGIRDILAACLHVGASKRVANCDGGKDEGLGERNGGAIENQRSEEGPDLMNEILFLCRLEC